MFVTFTCKCQCVLDLNIYIRLNFTYTNFTFCCLMHVLPSVCAKILELGVTYYADILAKIIPTLPLERAVS